MGASFGSRPRSAREWTPAEVRSYLSQLLARRSWSRQGLLDRLSARGVPAERAHAALADFESRGYVDDKRYAEGWAQARAQRGLGARRIAEELKQKGVGRDLADRAARESFEEIDEPTRAREIARRRLPGLLARGKAQAPTRLRTFLLRRGFPPGVVSGVIRLLLGVKPDELH